jgi:hypothetical protein
LVGEVGGSAISNKTYNCLWENLLINVEYKKDASILNYWRRALSYFSDQLVKNPLPYYKGTTPFKRTDDELNVERNKFKEFHHAMGALLVEHKMYSCLRQVFEQYDTSVGTKIIFPSTIEEILLCIVETQKGNYSTWIFCYENYQLSTLDQAHTLEKLHKPLKQFYAIFFIRYVKNLADSKLGRHLDNLTIEVDNRAERKSWITGLDLVIRQVEVLLKDSLFCNEFDLNSSKILERDEFGVPLPVKILNEFKSQIGDR